LFSGFRIRHEYRNCETGSGVAMDERLDARGVPQSYQAARHDTPDEHARDFPACPYLGYVSGSTGILGEMLTSGKGEDSK
jgi:hypothetical protein